MAERWLSLTVSSLEAGSLPTAAHKYQLRISAPKKIIKLAVKRNRVRRLIREVLRKEFVLEAGSFYHFKIRRAPENPDYQSTKDAVWTAWNAKK